MTCAACATRIEKPLEGVDASVNVASETARVRYGLGLTTVEQLVPAIPKGGIRRKRAP
ncbi:MAG: cation transporter [Vicinamibacterales bacterium]